MGMSQRRRVAAPLAVTGILALALAGCAEGDTSGGSGDGGSSSSKTTVRISGTITGTEADAINKTFEQFTKDTGITVQYAGDKGFEANIVTKVTGGDAPDIAIIPQPGLLKTLVDTGKVMKGSDAVAKNVDDYWSADWKDYGSIDGTFYAAPMLANVKGYIWYSPAKFKELGVEVPKTWDGLLELTKKLSADGTKPWCAGFASGDASGWPGTDWIEDMVLRQSGTEVYDKWVAGDVKFTDPEIEKAFDAVGTILKDPNYVNAGFGDVASINSAAFGDMAAKVADGSCLMTHQASFLSVNFADAKTAAGATPEVAPDGDVYAFVMPGLEEGSNTIEGGGEFVAGFNEDEATQKVLEFMSSPEWADLRVEQGGVISANRGADPSKASSAFLQDAMKLMQDEKTTFRFDASDLMPSTVGAGSFWKGMVGWIDGKDTKTVLSDIQAGYQN